MFHGTGVFDASKKHEKVKKKFLVIFVPIWAHENAKNRYFKKKVFSPPLNWKNNSFTVFYVKNTPYKNFK